MLLFTVFLANILYAAEAANLRCYFCNNINQTANCDTVEPCSDPSELCDGNEIIGRSLHRRQEGDYEFQCCSTDQCNKQLGGLIFRITTHIGGDVADAWANGTKTVSDENCRNVRTHGCPVHYRNPIVDKWASLNIRVVKYALYEHGKEVAYIYFNGTGSTMMNWFSKDRIINSTWVDIKTTPTNAFGIDVGFPPNRRFYINKDWGGCQNDHGWTVIISGHHVCNFDNQNNPYPYILYAKGNTYKHYDEINQFGEADVAAVYIYQN